MSENPYKGTKLHTFKSQERITQEEMFEMFGTRMPIEAANLVWEAPNNMTVGEIRKKLRDMAKERE